MEFLRKTTLLFAASLALLSLTANAAPIEGLVLRAGLDAEIIYDGNIDDNLEDDYHVGEFPINFPTQMAVDPQTGEIYLSHSTAGGDGQTLIINPTTGAARVFPFSGNGLGFNKDGSIFYFGLSNLMLGVWYRDNDEYRKFSILPGVEAVQVFDDGSAKGRLLVANSDYGKNILGKDTVWEVDQEDGYYSPVMTYTEGSEATGVNFAAVVSMAVDGAGNIYTLSGKGKVLVYKTDGTYQEGISAPVTSSGLMQGGLGVSPDGMVFLQDTSSAEVFAFFEDGSQVLVGYGSAFEQASSASDGGITSDGQSIYLTNARHKVIRIFATDGSPLLSALQTNLGTATINGIISDKNGAPLAGVTVSLRDKGRAPTITGADGSFEFQVPAGLYHVHASLPNYSAFNGQVSAISGEQTDLEMGMVSFLPGYLAPGLAADIIATNSNDSTEGSSDVTFDLEGNLYSINAANSTISKTILAPESRDVVETYIAAVGGVGVGMDNAWFIVTDDELNMYTSSGNSGVMRLPPASPDELITLILDSSASQVTVRDQNGIDRMVSYVTDIDGGAKLSSGDILFSSGNGGSIVDGFPDGTLNSIIRYSPTSGAQSLYSRGLPSGSNVPVINNPDILKTDDQDTLYVTNRGGNVATINTSGNGTLVWPGDNTGSSYPEGLGSYTAFTPDFSGGRFLKGLDVKEGPTKDVSMLRMIDPANDHNLLIVASELSANSGFGGFEFDPLDGGRSVVLSEWDFVLRIRTLDGRTIAENIISPPPGAQATINKGASLTANPASKASYIPLKSQQPVENFSVIDPATVKLPDLWFYEKSSETPVETSTSGGGTISWLLLCGLFWFNRKKLLN